MGAVPLTGRTERLPQAGCTHSRLATLLLNLWSRQQRPAPAATVNRAHRAACRDSAMLRNRALEDGAQLRPPASVQVLISTHSTAQSLHPLEVDSTHAPGHGPPTTDSTRDRRPPTTDNTRDRRPPTTDSRPDRRPPTTYSTHDRRLPTTDNTHHQGSRPRVTDSTHDRGLQHPTADHNRALDPPPTAADTLHRDLQLPPADSTLASLRARVQ